MDGKYLKVFVDWLERYRKLSDAEFGRLVRAAIAYKATGNQPNLSGREELLFDGIKLDIDRDQAKYDSTCSSRSEAGKKGAQSRWQNDKNSKCHLPSGKNDQDKDKDQEDIVPRARGNDNGAWLSDEEAAALEADLDAVLTEAQAIGIPMSQRDMDRGTSLVADYSAGWVLEALKRAVDAPGTARSWRYVEAILRNARKEGGFDAKSREAPLGSPDASPEELKGAMVP